MKREQANWRVAELPARERPVNRLREVGPQAVSDAELLACIVQTVDALNQARSLLQVVGGLTGLARADAETLMELSGIGPATAARILAAMELGRRMSTANAPERVQIRAPQDAAYLLMPLIGYQEQEHFAVLYLDTRNQVVDQEVLYRGTLNASLVRVAEVFRGAVKRNVAAIIVGHNHPSGDTSPSSEDVVLTRRLVEAGDLMDVALLDHVIVGGNRWTSLRERGVGFN